MHFSSYLEIVHFSSYLEIMQFSSYLEIVHFSSYLEIMYFSSYLEIMLFISYFDPVINLFDSRERGQPDPSLPLILIPNKTIVTVPHKDNSHQLFLPNNIQDIIADTMETGLKSFKKGIGTEANPTIKTMNLNIKAKNAKRDKK